MLVPLLLLLLHEEGRQVSSLYKIGKEVLSRGPIRGVTVNIIFDPPDSATYIDIDIDIDIDEYKRQNSKNKIK